MHIPITIIFNWICVLQLPSIDFFLFCLFLLPHSPSSTPTYELQFFLYLFYARILFFRLPYGFPIILISIWNFFFVCSRTFWTLRVNKWMWVYGWWEISEQHEGGKCKKHKKQKNNVFKPSRILPLSSSADKSKLNILLSTFWLFFMWLIFYWACICELSRDSFCDWWWKIKNLIIWRGCVEGLFSLKFVASQALEDFNFSKISV